MKATVCQDRTRQVLATLTSRAHYLELDDKMIWTMNC